MVVKLRMAAGQIDSSRCECKDSQKPQNRGKPCKHVLAVIAQHEANREGACAANAESNAGVSHLSQALEHAHWRPTGGALP